MNTPEASTLTRGQLARRAGIHPETVRYYEQRRLLPKPRRSARDYRLYDAEAVRRLHFIKRAQKLGFTLDEIGELLSLRATPEASHAEVRHHALEKIEAVEAKLRDLTRIKQTLKALVQACHEGGSDEACPILQALDFSAFAAHLPSNTYADEPTS